MKTIIQDIVETSFKYPKRKAVADSSGWYSYERLETISDQMAVTIIRRAKRQGINLGKQIVEGKGGLRIGVIMPRTKDFLLATIGILKAGCAYVPMEPGYPLDRINTILDDSQCNQIVTTKDVLRDLRAKGLDFPEERIILMENVLLMSPAKAHVSNFDYSMEDNEGLIIYTSGSTGKPKGVVHTMSIFPLIEKPLERFHQMTENSNTASLASFTFLASLLDLYSPLRRGGSVYVLNEEERLDLRLLHDAIVKNDVDNMFMPPKLAISMINTYKDLPIHALVCAGEKMLNPPETDIKLVDVYGTSEIGSVVSRIIKKTPNEALLGSCVEGYTPYLIDEQGNIIKEPKVVGEFCIVTPSLALYYNNLPEQTAEKFVECPFEPGKRMYKTGDLMAWTEDGELEFHGRRDYMVKVNGFRVELGEIESVLSKHEALTDVACVLKNVNGGENLCFYYVTKPGMSVSEDELKAFAAKKLAHYMVPSIYVHIDVMPRNQNGKVDRLHLPAPVATETVEYVAPETATEKSLHKIFIEILGLQQLGVTSNLRSEGLDSMLTMQAIVTISEQLGLDLDVETIFKLQSIKNLAQLIDSGKAKTKSRFKVYPKTDVYPAPKGMVNYMSAHVKGNRTLYVGEILRIEAGKLPEMEKALNAVADAHPSMKVRGDRIGRKFVILRDDEKPLPYLSKKIDFEPDADWIIENCFRGAEIVGGYMVNYALVESPRFGYVICQGSHAALDGSSMLLFNREFCTALAGGQPSPEKYTIYDYALDEQKYYRTKAMRADEQYYVDTAKGLKENILPFEKKPEVDDWYEATYSFLVDKVAVDNFCKKNDVSQNSFFCSAYMQGFAKMGRWKNVMISSLQSNRSCPELANILNLTMRNYPIVSRNTVSLDEADFKERMLADMRSVQTQVVKAMKMNFYDFYSSGSAGSKSPNSFDKSTFLYYAGLTDLITRPVEESNILGRDVTSITPQTKGFKKMANDSLCVHINLDISGDYEVKLVFNNKDYRKARMQKLAGYIEQYIKKLIED